MDGTIGKIAQEMLKLASVQEEEQGGKMSEELEQQRAKLHHSIAERLQVAQQAIDRDRQWLEWATSFKIDELQGRSIKISSYPHLDGSRYWLVEWGGRHLSNSG